MLVTNVSLHDLSQRHQLVWPERDSGLDAALQSNRTDGDTWRPDLVGRSGGQVCEAQFIYAWRSVNAGQVHRLRHLLRYEIHDEFVCSKDIDTGVLIRPSGWGSTPIAMTAGS